MRFSPAILHSSRAVILSSYQNSPHQRTSTHHGSLHQPQPHLITLMPVILKQTSREVKAAYRRGPRPPSEREIRRLENLAAADRRAEELRERERRRKANKRKREEKARMEREARRENGIGYATQACGWSLSQHRQKAWFEGYMERARMGDHGKARGGDASLGSPTPPRSPEHDATVEQRDGPEMSATPGHGSGQDPGTGGGDDASNAINDITSSVAGGLRLGASEPWDADEIDDASLIAAISDKTHTSETPPTRPIEPPAARATDGMLLAGEELFDAFSSDTEIARGLEKQTRRSQPVAATADERLRFSIYGLSTQLLEDAAYQSFED